MLIACWSAKGGSGTTVVAVALAALLAEAGRSPLLIDLSGDAAVVLGQQIEPETAGVGDWLTTDELSAAGLARLEREVAGEHRLTVIPAGTPTPVVTAHDTLFAAVLAADVRPVVVDAGLGGTGVSEACIAAAHRSLLVTRSCFLALSRAARAQHRATGAVLLSEPGRALGPDDVSSALGVPVVAEVLVDPAVARAVDAGTLAAKLPRSLARSLRAAA